MHTPARTWNVPLGIGLFGAAILVGGAILAYPETTKGPSHVDVSDPIATKPFPSFPEETHPTIPGSQLSDESATTKPKSAEPRAPLPAPTAIGGGPAAESTDVDDEPPPTRAPIAAPPTPVPVAPNTASGGDASAPATPAADATGAPTEPPEAGAAETGEGGTLGSTAVGDAKVDPNAPYVFPTFGAPAAGSPTSTTTGATSDGGITTTGGTGGGGGVATTKANITAPMMLPMSDASAADRFWTAIAPFLRAGDVVVATVASDTSPLLAFADRVRTDAPVATYVVAFATPAQLESALAKGVPATLGVVGLSNTTAVKDAALTTIATKVHDNGRRLFLSVKVPSDGPTLAAVGKSADIVELVIAGANGTELGEQAKTAAATIGSRTQLFVRLPTSLANASAAPSAAKDIVTAVSSAGVAIPYSDDLATSMSDYRTR